MLSAEKHVEQHAERIDIGRGRHRCPEHLLRRGELRRQRATRFPGELACLAGLGLVLEQLGDAEVEQLHRTVIRDQHVRRLDIPMHDQVRMRMRDRGEHIEKQSQTPLHVKPPAVTIVVDPFTLDEVQDQVRLARRRDACVDQSRDVRMREPGQDIAFAAEALLAGLPDQRGVQELDRYLALEAPVAAPGEPHATHAALAKRRFKRIGADELAG